MAQSDSEIITPEQCRMARAGLQMTVSTLAELAGVSPSSVTRFENDEPCHRPDALRRIRTTFEARGIEFTNDEAPGVRLRPLREFASQAGRS